MDAKTALFVIALALAVMVALSVFYLRGSDPSVRKARLRAVAKAHFLGNTIALRPFQTGPMQDERSWAEYDAVLEEPDNLKEHVLWPCVLCIATVFSIALILFVAFEFGYYQRPSMILGGALQIGSFVKGCPGWDPILANASSKCTRELQLMVDTYQLGTLQVVLFSFLAAYIWAIWQLFQRMVTRDVTVYAFHVITVRVVTSAILSLIFYQGITTVDKEEVRRAVEAAGEARPGPAEPPSAQSDQRRNQADPLTPPAQAAQGMSLKEAVNPPIGYLMLLAVAIGFFPEAAIRWIGAKARETVFRMGPTSSYLDIEALEGIDTFSRARLAEVGIIDATHLANSNPVTLAIRTPFPFSNLSIGWVRRSCSCSLSRRSSKSCENWGFVRATSFMSAFR